MLGKVALRNIRRSVKDYAIYFVTLLMAVTLFYAFNSISEQQVMTEINESSHMDVSQFVGEMGLALLLYHRLRIGILDHLRKFALDQAPQARIRHVFHAGYETDTGFAHHHL